MPIARPWWSHLRLGVRGLIVVVLLIGGCMGWIVRSGRIQREAVAAVQRAGGSVAYDYQRTVSGGKPGPRWLLDYIGIDYLDNVFSVSLSGKATDQLMWHVGHLAHLELLSLDGSRVTDAGLVHLQGLHELRRLWLSRTKITDEGLRHVSGLIKLRTLVLSNSPVTDRGLANVERLTRLKGFTWKARK